MRLTILDTGEITSG